MMLTEARRSYALFRNSHGGRTGRRLRLTDGCGRILGVVERHVVQGHRTRIEGWADAGRIFVLDASGARLGQVRPNLQRPDVQRRLRRDHAAFGFDITVPARGRLVLVLEHEAGPVRAVLDQPSGLGRALSEAGTALRYLRTVAGSAPDVLRWIVQGDEEARRRLGTLLRDPDPPPPGLNPGLLDGQGWPPLAPAPITIVLPVYDGHDLIDPVIGRVAANTDLPWHLVVIDDASPDPRISPLLAAWRNRLGPDRVTLLTNPRNLGFVGSANRGLAQAIARGHDVVLLNSDAFVGPGWAGRLLAPLRNGAQVASVTPMSNDAEIANVPDICVASPLEGGEGDLLDRAAADLDGPGAVADVPTGVGFCMAMNIEALRRLPAFDAAFGMGYGEEVDWCQRAWDLGWRSVLTTGVFVEHQGGQSFGSEAKQRRIAENGRIITSRYPGFDAQVQQFIATDPLRTQRLALGLTLARHRAGAAGARLSVFIGHALGGGAETYLGQRIGRELDTTGHALVLRAMQDGTWKVELHGRRGQSVGLAVDAGAALAMLGEAGGLNVVYSCAVGTPRPLAIPALLLALKAQPGSTLEVTFNDYYPISPSYTLLDSRAVFAGVPGADDGDPAHRFVREDGSEIPLSAWREAWGQVIARADRIVTFSNSSAEIVGAAWPEARDRMEVRPHALPVGLPRISPKASGTPTIGILGNINVPKGARVLTRLSAELARSGSGRLVLIGNLEPGHELAAPAVITGSYQLDQLPYLIKAHGIDRWLFPSIWPETFSYAVHEMISTGLPVHAFDVGAQAEAVRAALSRGHQGTVVPLPDGEPDIAALAALLTRD
ncbi:glycosyltransferase [Paracoccus sp. (in: a-proteobacteria)]|uniref:glycosyltransferase n=1 Tax=Paracoccus sp. TaxID=267 RepID=UPI0026DFFE5E|nr:glycosyltransferase [Paracoccus sp. (in: a-proteobacteria)]MDO5371438.1 glycosyltransferase [Paracoccus sp. (in: a-proteobacteria)]